MIVFSRKTIRIAEIYFTDSLPSSMPHVDLIRYGGILAPIDEANWKRSDTIIIDLSRVEDVLLNEMDSGTRYEIRRAQGKDSLNYIVLDTPSRSEVDSFCDYYDNFAKSKSLGPVFRPRLYALTLSNNLMLSCMCDSEGNALVQHAHLVMPERAMLLYSASQFREINDSAIRSLIGRANRLLHWRDIQTAKQRGIPIYDLCGVDVTNRTPETTRIASFKLGFGGNVVPSFSRTAPASIKGRLVNALLGLAGKSF